MSKWRIDIAKTDKTSQSRETDGPDEHREADRRTDGQTDAGIAFYH